MRYQRGVQKFTTGFPDRTYWYNGRSDRFRQIKTHTSSNSLPAVIAYLNFQDGKFVDSYAFLVRGNADSDGNYMYRLRDGSRILKEEIMNIHEDHKRLREIYRIIHRRAKTFPSIVEMAQKELHLDEQTATTDLGWLLLNEAVEYNINGRITTRV